MVIDAITATLLGTVLGSSGTRSLFTTIANRRIAEAGLLKQDNPDADQQLKALENADLIGAGANGEKYYVTAKGLKVARDLEKLPIAQ